jgi:diguanylate cyclase (GGDEF)-like protein
LRRKIDLKILYVEDDPDIRESIKIFLGRRIEQLFVAQNGQEGLELFLKYSPDLVITDINMPIKNGLDMIRDIKNSTKTDSIFIITSAYSDAEFFTQAIDLTVDSFLIKPIDITKLNNSINKIYSAKITKQELEFERKKTKILFDFQDNLVLLTDGKELKEANKSFLDFFCYANVDEFRAHNTSLSDIIDIDINKDFLDKIILSQEKYVVKIFDKKRLENRIFLLKAINFPDHNELYILSLTDITEIEKEKLLLEKLATTDVLTEAYNRGKFYSILKQRIDEYKQKDVLFSLIMFDIDHFKLINDTFGHDIGDAVLIDISRLVRETIRDNDTFARWGGEEFMILAYDTIDQEAYLFAHRIRELIQNYRFKSIDGSVTSSFGVTQIHKDDGIDSITKRTDNALYMSKNSGRNRVTLI